MRAEHRASATYVPVDSAFNLEKSIKTTTEVNVRVRESKDDELEIPKTVVFRPPWPSHLVHVHPADSHGRCPEPLPLINMTGEHRGLLAVIGMVLHNSNLYDGICSRVTNNWNWRGFGVCEAHVFEALENAAI